MWLRAGAVVDDSVSGVSPVNTESTVVWSNGATQCDSTLQLNIWSPSTTYDGGIDNSDISN